MLTDENNNIVAKQSVCHLSYITKYPKHNKFQNVIHSRTFLDAYRNVSLLLGQATVKKEHPRRISMEC